MNSLLRILSLVLAVAVLTVPSRLSAGEDAPPFAAELSDSWRARITTFATPRALVAPFTESRTLPLKKAPIVVDGTVRIVPKRGLSLAYDEKREPVVILDEQGLLLRYPDGRQQKAPGDAEASVRLLHALFAFDLSALEKLYTLVATENPDASWSLTFTRRPEVDSRNAPYRELSVSGDATRLTRIVLTKATKQKIEIALGVPEFDPEFTPNEFARFFR